MNKNILSSLLAVAALALGACSGDPEPQPTPDPEVYPSVVLTFEGTGIAQAGPTSYGDNLYADYTGTTPALFTAGELPVDAETSLRFAINEADGVANFYNGGCALSSWNRFTGANADDHSWYDYTNQCSVYNSASVSGADEHAGHGGSDTFMVITGTTEAPSLSFTGGAERVIEELWVANAAYTYGVAMYGNGFARSLRDTNGWLSVSAYGYDAQGHATNGGQPVELYLCDYRVQPVINLSTTWQLWSLTDLGPVNSVRFVFSGSDSGEWGLNTPAYLCLDDLRIRTNQ